MTKSLNMLRHGYEGHFSNFLKRDQNSFSTFFFAFGFYQLGLKFWKERSPHWKLTDIPSLDNLDKVTFFNSAVPWLSFSSLAASQLSLESPVSVKRKESECTAQRSSACLVNTMLWVRLLQDQHRFFQAESQVWIKINFVGKKEYRFYCTYSDQGF